ncbi:DUF3068 domain-containing protein [Williamsia herbipolensis]|uniref:DUF3068 domain-containing protein n=1 Tax=Williamsia herbipolensis TaxID=1603258 RepID=UPI0009E4B546|nr:DUF3068 domain-containing protein [Williamsia herbipolensis]
MAVTSKRTVGFLGIAVGAGLVAVAILLPTVVVPGAKRLPAEISQSIVATANNAEVLDSAAVAAGGKVATERGVPLRVDIRVRSEPPTSDRQVTVSAAARTARTDRQGDAAIVSAYVDRVSLNRRTARPLKSPTPAIIREATGTAKAAPRTGFQYNFPLGVARRSYPLYDTETQTSPDASYIDDQRSVDGVKLFHFRQVISNDNLYERLGSVASLTVPGGAVGRPAERLVRLDLIYSVRRDLWVEPNTGQIVDEQQQIHRELVSGPSRVTSLRANINFSKASVDDAAAMARSNVNLLRWGTLWLPIILAILGGVFLVLGSVIVGRSRPHVRTTA